jgi:hypothetical protein
LGAPGRPLRSVSCPLATFEALRARPVPAGAQAEVSLGWLQPGHCYTSCITATNVNPAHRQARFEQTRGSRLERGVCSKYMQEGSEHVGCNRLVSWLFVANVVPAGARHSMRGQPTPLSTWPLSSMVSSFSDWTFGNEVDARYDAKTQLATEST